MAEGLRQFGLDHPNIPISMPEFATVEDPAQPGRKAQWIRDFTDMLQTPEWDQLVTAIRRIAAGGAFVSPETAEQLALDANRAHHGGPPHTLLSDREFQVFELIVNGKSVSDVARQLALSVKTVSTHKTRILHKMGVTSEAELVRYALEHKLLDPPAGPRS